MYRKKTSFALKIYCITTLLGVYSSCPAHAGEHSSWTNIAPIFTAVAVVGLTASTAYLWNKNKNLKKENEQLKKRLNPAQDQPCRILLPLPTAHAPDSNYPSPSPCTSLSTSIPQLLEFDAFNRENMFAATSHAKILRGDFQTGDVSQISNNFCTPSYSKPIAALYRKYNGVGFYIGISILATAQSYCLLIHRTDNDSKIEHDKFGRCNAITYGIDFNPECNWNPQFFASPKLSDFAIIFKRYIRFYSLTMLKDQPASVQVNYTVENENIGNESTSATYIGEKEFCVIIEDKKDKDFKASIAIIDQENSPKWNPIHPDSPLSRLMPFTMTYSHGTSNICIRSQKDFFTFRDHFRRDMSYLINKWSLLRLAQEPFERGRDHPLYNRGLKCPQLLAVQNNGPLCAYFFEDDGHQPARIAIHDISNIKGKGSTKLHSTIWMPPILCDVMGMKWSHDGKCIVLHLANDKLLCYSVPA